ncbi:MAG: undecaprenyl-phosphate glucose phosphotransferase [Gallionellales bacterium RIFCSPHIGHO2_02_FULL_57_16]|nr:MAG: undecaprenyl-phosphate glucose phosphotransferase [Gallionellales bacterium RIFCSPHIGHO2_02_FULL_57_16]
MPDGFLRSYSSGISVFQRLIDVGIITAIWWLSHRLYGIDIADRNIVLVVLAVACFYFIAEAKGLYASWRTGGLVAEITDLVIAWGMVVVVLVMLAFMTKTSANFSRRVVMTWFVLAPFGMVMARMLVRIILRELRRAGRNTRTLAIVGANAQAVRLIEKSRNAPWMGMLPLGIYDDMASESVPDEIRRCLKGSVADLIQMALAGRVDYIYIALSMQQESRIMKLVDALADTTVSVYVVPDMFISDLLHARWTNFHGVPAIRVYETPFMGVNGLIKRLEDLFLGALFMGIALLPMVAIGVAIKLTSPGPAIFRQRRYGLNGEIVDVWKFRTMTVCEDCGNIPQAKRNDPRITPLGKFLRRTSLDEFPQLINVLQGRMSLVGPRPHAVAHNEQYRKLIHGYMLRHKVKPGITGLAQINGWRGETDTLNKMEKRIEYDLEYIRNWSLWVDIKIIWLTLFRGFLGKNAY